MSAECVWACVFETLYFGVVVVIAVILHIGYWSRNSGESFWLLLDIPGVGGGGGGRKKRIHKRTKPRCVRTVYK